MQSSVEHKLNNDIKDIHVRKFQYEIIYLYTKVIMHNTQKICVYIFCDNNLYYHMRWWLASTSLGL
jgi:hypothetical protein